VAGYAKLQGAKLALAWMNRAARHTPKGPWARVGRLGGYYKLKYYEGFDALVANTEDIAEWVVSQGWPAGRVRCIPNFAAAPAEVAPADRSGLRTPKDAPLLLAMGRLHESKAHDVALQALAKLSDAFLWIAGTGPEEARLKAMAAALGVMPRVRFLGWRTDASALYRAADVCLFPSRYEPLGNVVIQAWAHGLPVAAAASQGPGALIDDGKDGLLVPVDDPEALADAASRLLADASLRKRLAGRGLKRVELEFSEAAVVAQWTALFSDIGAI
jgi:glycosyltransferase involved in cell wall biosynthesis